MEVGEADVVLDEGLPVIFIILESTLLLMSSFMLAKLPFMFSIFSCSEGAILRC